jgi:gamma-glutamyltranspeptidase/glutathione hydrolase
VSKASRQAAVAAGDQQTVDAAASVLRSGGNAVDAALGAGFAAAVSEPGLTSLGGGGFLLVRDSRGSTTLLDFFVDAPGRGLPTADLTPHFDPVTIDFSGALQVFHAGFGSVAVPGVLPGYLMAHRSFGQLRLSEVVAPAAALARSGATLSSSQATVLHLLRDILALTPGASDLFFSNGAPPPTGGLLRNPAYATFLQQLGDLDPASWADIPQTRHLIEQMRQYDGLLTMADLADYRVRERVPHTAHYRGAALTTNPPPSFGGSIVCRALVELDAGASATPSPVAQVEALHIATGAQKSSGATSSKGTTHVSVIDSDGMIASMTTSNGSCSGVLVPDTGVQLNNMMGESDLHPDGFHGAEPGSRVASMMAPSVLDLPDGSVVALGSGGSERIRSALLQTVVRLVGGASLAHAVGDPRVHFDGTTSQLEPGVPEQVADQLAAIGPVHRWQHSSVYFGGVNAVRRHPDGHLEAFGDSRRDGAGAVIDL